jgi:hypothetical protein
MTLLEMLQTTNTVIGTAMAGTMYRTMNLRAITVISAIARRIAAILWSPSMNLYTARSSAPIATLMMMPTPENQA